ncbi:hypothetical protein BASA60_010545, partial [Batrachochytrium salamandrivorans]
MNPSGALPAAVGVVATHFAEPLLVYKNAGSNIIPGGVAIKPDSAIELPDPRYIAGPSTSAATAGASAGAAAAAGAASGGESSGGSAVSGADADGRQLRHETSNTINNIIAAVTILRLST